MKLKVYSIHDQAAEAFVQPFFMHNDGLAIRAFQDNANAKDENNISKHPEQFALYQIGEFDDKQGTIEPLQEPKLLATALELKTDTVYSEATVKEMLTAIQNSIEGAQK